MKRATPPVRVILSRKKGWKMPPNTVSVARPSRWGNPFKIGPQYNVFQAVDHFRAHLMAGKLKITIEDVRRELRGKNLACWCKASPCHADVLLDLANTELCHGAASGAPNSNPPASAPLA